MKSKDTSRTATRKSFLVFGVLSPQNRAEQQVPTMKPKIEKNIPQAVFKVWRLRRYET